MTDYIEKLIEIDKEFADTMKRGGSLGNETTGHSSYGNVASIARKIQNKRLVYLRYFYILEKDLFEYLENIDCLDHYYDHDDGICGFEIDQNVVYADLETMFNALDDYFKKILFFYLNDDFLYNNVGFMSIAKETFNNSKSHDLPGSTSIQIEDDKLSMDYFSNKQSFNDTIQWGFFYPVRNSRMRNYQQGYLYLVMRNELVNTNNDYKIKFDDVVVPDTLELHAIEEWGIEMVGRMLKATYKDYKVVVKNM